MQHRSPLPLLAGVAIGYALFTGIGGIAIMLTSIEGSKALPSIFAEVIGSRGLVLDILQFAFSFFATHLLVALAWHLLWLPINRRLLSGYARNRSLAVLGFLPVLLWITLTAAARHPYSSAAIDMGPLLQALWLATWAYILAVPVLTAVLVIGALHRRLQARRTHPTATRPPVVRRAQIGLAAAILLGMAFALAMPGDDDSGLTRDRGRPDILLIGVDSVRVDHVGFLNDSTPSLTPEMDDLLSQAAIFENAWTPFGRTFPAWVSILTGAHPPSHGGIFNLIDRDRVDDAGSLTHWIEALGYHRLYAIDETRFSNLDASYGFDQVVTPHIGALEFLLLGIGEAPLIKLIANTPIGRPLFPAIHGNRGIAGAYRPATFDRMLTRAIDTVDPDLPLFLTVHYELPHWPYEWAYSPHFEVDIPEQLEDLAAESHQKAVARVDQQIATLLEGLRHAGRLDNAIVVLLSDHGEAFTFSEPEWQPQSKSAGNIPRPSGHGTNVLSPAQNQVILGFRGFGPQRERVEPRLDREITASLSDIEPTLGDWLAVPLDQRRPRDGRSLLPAIAEGRAPFPETRAVPLETGFSAPSVELGNPDEAELIEKAQRYYRITPAGRLVLEERWLPEILRWKQRGVASGDWLLGAYPRDIEAGDWRLLLANRQNYQHWNVRDPGLPAEAPVEAMVEGLCHWFGQQPRFTLPECSPEAPPRENGSSH